MNLRSDIVAVAAGPGLRGWRSPPPTPYGAACSGVVTVGVPHDQRPGSTAVDSGGSFDSLAS